MPSGVFDDALIKHLFSTDELRAIFSERNRVQKWYDFEAALALEQAELGIIPRKAAEEIARNAKVESVDIEAIAAEIRRIKHPRRDVPFLQPTSATSSLRIESARYMAISWTSWQTAAKESYSHERLEHLPPEWAPDRTET